MKKLINIGIFFVLAYVVASQNTMATREKKEETAEEFALRIKNLVLSGDVEKFRQLPIFPHDPKNPDHRIFDDEIEHVLNYKNFLAQDKIQIKIYGPYTYEDGLNGANYNVIYFDPDQVQFDKKYVLPSIELTEKLWGKGFLETQIVKVGNRWAFYYSIFHYGTDWPSEEDYP